jgi:hypothetical protein
MQQTLTGRRLCRPELCCVVATIDKVFRLPRGLDGLTAEL